MLTTRVILAGQTRRSPQGINVVSRANGGFRTGSLSALAAAIEHLKKGNRDKKVLIVVSGGGDNTCKHNLRQIMTMAGKSDVIIYTIGIYTGEDPDKKPDALRGLSHATRGAALLPGALTDVVPLCERIAHDIREQYALAYAPMNRKQDGAYRVIADDFLILVTCHPFYFVAPPPKVSSSAHTGFLNKGSLRSLL